MQCQTQKPHLIVIPYDPARIVLHAANILYSSGLKTHIATLHYLSDTNIRISDGFNQGPRRAELLRGRSPSIERKYCKLGIRRKFCECCEEAWGPRANKYFKGPSLLGNTQTKNVTSVRICTPAIGAFISLPVLKDLGLQWVWVFLQGYQNCTHRAIKNASASPKLLWGACK